MTITLKTSSFVKLGTYTWKSGETTYVDVVGTIEMDLGGRTVTAKARVYEDGDIAVAGFVGRYLTSTKPWIASVRFDKEGKMARVWFGRDDRSGRFNKANAISYEPETWASLVKRDTYSPN